MARKHPVQSSTLSAQMRWVVRSMHGGIARWSTGDMMAAAFTGFSARPALRARGERYWAFAPRSETVRLFVKRIAG